MEQHQTTPIQRFLSVLAEYVRRDERGALADLRHGFSPATEYRAWPYVAKWCDLADDRERRIWTTIAAGFATHKRTVPGSNMGSTLRAIALSDAGGTRTDGALSTFDARFRRLLTCGSAEEVCVHLVGVIRTAERKNVPIDFEQLYWDLLMWQSPKRDVRVQWASHYWGAETAGKGGDAE